MMNKNLQERVERLHKQIDDLRYRYHVQNDPEVTDKMYEGLMDELKKIEKEYPEYITKDSPTQRVAGKPLEKFVKIVHEIPQWSFDDAFNREDLDQWEERNHKMLAKELGSVPKDLTYAVELKIDGLHIVLTYENGELLHAATRGDGKIGEDVTQNIRTFQSVPLKLTKPVSIVVEGEAWMPQEILEKINIEREMKNEPLFANPRNAAAGTIRQLDAKVVAERKLSLTVYDISRVTEGDLAKSIDTQEHELQMLEKLGFLTDHHWKICKSIDEIMDMYEQWTGKQRSQPFWVDGLVIKMNQLKYQKILGYTGKSPRWGIAVKFPAEQGTTKIKDIYVQVGRTGVLTPVAHMEPVQLVGTTVTHATLHNFDEIERLDVRVGDTVVVEKAGDIIPKVVRVLTKMRTGKEKKIYPPKVCPICESEVQRKDIQEKQKKSAGYFCTNKKCYSQQLRKISHFVSKKAMDMDGLGKKIVEQLVEEGIIQNIADIYTLTKGDLEPLERFGDKSAQNLIDAIELSKKTTLGKFIFALGIPHVGEETAIRLAEHFHTLEKIMEASKEEFAEVNDVGVSVAESLYSFFREKENKELIQSLRDNGVYIQKAKQTKTKGTLQGKTFVITGTLSTMTRDEAKDLIRKHGGEVSSSVSKNTTYLLAGENPGSKYDNAKKLNIPILTEEEFGGMVE
ncbi:MAG: NAD-dependent DNA ligase LigA [Candidatus Magasanikbacteria bacterium]